MVMQRRTVLKLIVKVSWMGVNDQSLKVHRYISHRSLKLHCLKRSNKKSLFYFPSSTLLTAKYISGVIVNKDAVCKLYIPCQADRL